MANVFVDTPPGFYLNPVDVNVSFGPEVKEVSLNMNGTPPSISKYISYDTLNPPNPFIAITQDGNGNVIYDGGFPKFYNTSAENPSLVRFRHALKVKSNRVGTGGEIRIGLSDAVTVIEAGDKLIYDMMVIGTDANYAIKGYVGHMSDIEDNETSITDTLVDQNGLKLQCVAGPALLQYSSNVWHTRTLDMSTLTGQSIGRWVLLGTSGPTGTSSIYFKNARVINAAGQVKNTLIGDDTYVPITEAFVTGNFGLVEHREASSFDLLTSAGKYALNGIDFIADQDEIRQGNRKILLIGDQYNGVNYAVKGTDASGFHTTFTRIAHHGYWDLTIKDRTDYGGNIDIRLPELKQYAAVLFMSSASGSVPLITQASIDAFVTYRGEGGGLFFITDHGVILNTIQEAQGTQFGFFVTANAIITRFGAWFSGDYNRLPVNVGFLRANYGDHPLYKNLDDSENMPAGVSESRVFVSSDPLVSPGTVTTNYPVVTGNNVINLLIVLFDGTIETYTFKYNIVDYKVTFISAGKTVDAGGTIVLNTVDKLKLSLGYVGAASRVMSGRIFVNGADVGSVQKLANSQFQITYTDPYLNNGLPINNDTFIYLKFTAPAGLEYSVRIDRTKIPVVDLSVVRTWSDLNRVIRNVYSELTPLGKLRKISNDSLDSGGKLSYTLPDTMWNVKNHLSGPYRASDTTIRLKVGSFNAPQHWYGFFLYAGGASGPPAGEVSPGNYLGKPLRDINSPVDNQMRLQLGTRDHVFTNCSVIYLDDIGPLYKILDAGSDAGGVHRLWFGNGVVNLYKYLESKLGQFVEIRILG